MNILLLLSKVSVFYSCQLNFSIHLDLGVLIGIPSVSERSNSLVIDKELDGVVLVLDDEIEFLAFLEGERSLTFFIAPFTVLKGVPNDGLLVESWVEVEEDVSLVVDQINFKARPIGNTVNQDSVI